MLDTSDCNCSFFFILKGTSFPRINFFFFFFKSNHSLQELLQFSLSIIIPLNMCLIRRDTCRTVYGQLEMGSFLRYLFIYMYKHKVRTKIEKNTYFKSRYTTISGYLNSSLPTAPYFFLFSNHPQSKQSQQKKHQDRIGIVCIQGPHI